jgi:hypothetical protein
MPPFKTEPPGLGCQPRFDGQCLDRRVLESGEHPLATQRPFAESVEFRGSPVASGIGGVLIKAMPAGNLNR